MQAAVAPAPCGPCSQVLGLYKGLLEAVHAESQRHHTHLQAALKLCP